MRLAGFAREACRGRCRFTASASVSQKVQDGKVGGLGTTTWRSFLMDDTERCADVKVVPGFAGVGALPHQRVGAGPMPGPAHSPRASWQQRWELVAGPAKDGPPLHDQPPQAPRSLAMP